MKWLAVIFLVAIALSVPGAPAIGNSRARKGKTGDHDGEEWVREGDAFRSQGQLSSALSAYRQAAKVGNVNGAFALGEMLFRQGQTSSGRERILQLSEGLGALFIAATHGDARACADLSAALENGIGVETNRIDAYAWMELAAQRNSSFESDLNRLVVKLAPDDVRQAQDLARKYAHGQWPDELVHPVDEGDSRLRIQGISGNGRESLVIINDVTFAVGESAIVRTANSPQSADREISVTCLKIGNGYTLVSIAGEPHFKLLSSKSMP